LNILSAYHERTIPGIFASLARQFFSGRTL
jgi:hypothetical protein